MKITRILTYNVSEDYIHDFYDFNWWEDKVCVDSDDFDYFIDSLRDESYDNEEIIYDTGVQEKMMHIWQEECDNYHKEFKEKNKKIMEKEILEEIQYYKNKIAFLEDRIKNMKGE